MSWAARALHCCSQRVTTWAEYEMDFFPFLHPVLSLGRDAWEIFCKLQRDGDRSLQLLIFNEEFLVNASHQLALITSLPFVHTARRYYRLNGLVSSLDCCVLGATLTRKREGDQTWSFRGSKSRNKVSSDKNEQGLAWCVRVYLVTPTLYTT